MIKDVIRGRKVILREKRLADAWEDFDWETDPELSQLDAAPPLDLTFSQYLLEYASELRSPMPTSKRFAVDTLGGKHIGNCSYYNIRETEGQAEVGIMIGDRNHWNQGYGTDAVVTLVDHIFTETALQRVHLKTLESNNRAKKCFQKCGFAPCGHSLTGEYAFYLMDIYRKQWELLRVGK